ncbi:adenosylhomocysteinase, partial [Gardnerella vaginalis]|nr:adenosylhomocysteinase [Gardnerella vaginalis]
LECVVKKSNMIVSATGVRHTITLQHMQNMQENAILAVIGGIANEIALDEIPDFKPFVGTSQRKIQVPCGPQITLISEGDGTNYTTGGGNPIEIMDFSFAVQVSAVAYLLEHNGKNKKNSDKNRLDSGIYQLPESSDNQIASIALAERGYSASESNKDNGYRWDLTRFAEDENI